MPYSHILFQVEESGIALVTVNRPEKLNALSGAVIGELADAFGRVASDPAIRAAIVTGAGEKAFVAGADIGELGALSPYDARAFAGRGQAGFRQLESLGQAEVKLGIIPGYGGTQRLPRLVGRGRALELLLSGEAIPAAEAYRIGLVNAVVPSAELLDYCRGWLGKVLVNGPLAVGLVMDAVDVGLACGLEEGLRFEAAAFGISAATEDCREGTRAFLEKRRAAFTGK